MRSYAALWCLKDGRLTKSNWNFRRIWEESTLLNSNSLGWHLVKTDGQRAFVGNERI